MESAKDWQLEQPEDSTSSSPKGSGFRRWLRLLQRHAFLIAGVTGLSTLAAWFWAISTPAIYQGGFQLLVEPLTKEDRATDPTTIAGGNREPQTLGLDYATQLRILQGYDVLKEIVEKVRTRYPTFSFGRLREGLVVERVTGKTKLDQTKIIQVTYQDTNPEVAEFAIQTTSEKFLEYSLNQRKTRIGEAVKFIDQQIPDLRQRVNTIQSDLQKLQQKYQLTDPKTRGEELFSQARAASSQQQDVQRELRELRAVYAGLQKKLQLTPEQAIAATNLTQDATYQNLFGQIKQVSPHQPPNSRLRGEKKSISYFTKSTKAKNRGRSNLIQPNRRTPKQFTPKFHGEIDRYCRPNRNSRSSQPSVSPNQS
jgi:polysaccharide biosynthesis transport protein